MKTPRAMTGVQAGQVMTTNCLFEPAGTSLRKFVEGYLSSNGQRCFIVGLAADPRGIITLADVHTVLRHEWAQASVQAVMQALRRPHAVAPNTSFEEVLRLMEQFNVAEIAVIEDERELDFIGCEQFCI